MTSRHPRALLATASVAVALAAADTYVVVLALTDMMTGVGVGIDSLQEATPIVSGFLVGYVAVLPLIGRLADLVARQRVLLGCLAVFTAGSVVTALATDLPTLVGGRVVQGVGGGGLVPATLALVADLWPVGRRGTPLGVVGAVQELGSVLGPVVGALVLTVATWRAIFWLNAAAGVVLATAIRLTGDGRPRTSPIPRSDGSGRPRTSPIRRSDGSGRPRPSRIRRSDGSGQPRRYAGSRRRPFRLFTWVVGALAAALLVLALWAPAALANDVTLGIPFVPFGDATARLLTPVGVAGLVLVAGWLALALPSWWPLLRRADLPGALLLGTALGSVVLTFATSDPATEVVGPLGLVLLPVGLLALLLYGWRHRAAAEPLVPRGTVAGHGRVALAVSLLVGVALVAVVVQVPLLARLVLPDHPTDLGLSLDRETAAALFLLRFLVAVPIGAVVGGAALRRLGNGVVAGSGLTLAAVGLAVMSTWTVGATQQGTSSFVLAGVGLGIGLALAPVNEAALAAAPGNAHATASALVVVARMVGMVLGLALLTAVGLHAYYRAVAGLPDPTDGKALVGAALVQVHWVFRGAALAAAAGAVVAAVGLGRHTRQRP